MKQRKPMTVEEYEKMLARPSLLDWCIKHGLLVRIVASVVTALAVSLLFLKNQGAR